MSSLREQYERDGYVVISGAIPSDVLAGLQEDFDRIVQQLVASGEEINAKWASADAISGADSVVLHTHNVQQFSARWMQFFVSPGFLGAVSELIGPDIVLHHSKLFQKPAEKGAAFPMHQDWGYFPTRDDSMMAGIVHLSDATDAMGCLRVYPGSHKLGRIPPEESMTGANFMERFPLDGATALEAKAGDIVFFNYLTVHGSKPNTSDKVRKTVLVQIYSGADLPDDNPHPNERLTLSGWNYSATRNTANRLK